MDGDFWSWLAGFWEGEGTLGVYKDKRYPEQGLKRTVFQVVQSNKQPLEYILEQLEMKLRLTRDDRPRSPGVQRQKPSFVLQIQARGDVAYVCHKILPFLRFRRKEVQQKLAQIEKAISQAKYKHWTNEESSFLNDNALALTDEEIANHLGRTKSSVRSHRTQLRLLHRTRRNWNDEEIDFLEKNIETMTTSAIAKTLNRNRCSINKKIRELNLRTA